eukprot:14781057-Alexandrium_andersonii.AAC.1
MGRNSYTRSPDTFGQSRLLCGRSQPEVATVPACPTGRTALSAAPSPILGLSAAERAALISKYS